jgi:senataxin
MAERTKRAWQDNPRFGTYRFFNVHRGQEQKVGKSTSNPTEVQIAVHLYARLATEYKNIDFASRVGVVTPYRAQVGALRQAFRKRFGEDVASGIDFNSVDGFQGQEKDIIILSCVRAGPGLETIGFLGGMLWFRHFTAETQQPRNHRRTTHERCADASKVIVVYPWPRCNTRAKQQELG